MTNPLSEQWTCHICLEEYEEGGGTTCEKCYKDTCNNCFILDSGYDVNCNKCIKNLGYLKSSEAVERKKV